MSKFKVGDRVKVVGHKCSLRGKEATVTNVQGYIVSFETNTGSTCFASNTGPGEGHELQLIKSSSTPGSLRDRAHIDRIVWSDGVEIADDSIKIGDVTKTRAEWEAHAKLIRRALGRKGVKVDAD